MVSEFEKKIQPLLEFSDGVKLHAKAYRRLGAVLVAIAGAIWTIIELWDYIVKR